MSYGLKQRDIDFLLAAFGQFPEIEQVLIFGSRAKGNSKAGSDIDLAVKGANVTDTTITRLRATLNNLPLPYFFDLVDYKTIQNQDLLNHINRVGEVVYKK
jgi:predicted nucleotidyltransferase